PVLVLGLPRGGRGDLDQRAAPGRPAGPGVRPDPRGVRGQRPEPPVAGAPVARLGPRLVRGVLAVPAAVPADGEPVAGERPAGGLHGPVARRGEPGRETEAGRPMTGGRRVLAAPLEGEVGGEAQPSPPGGGSSSLPHPPPASSLRSVATSPS